MLYTPPPWIEISVENRPVFAKTGGDRFYRFIKNRSVKFEIFKK
jgi:hypothetical protein